MRKTKVNNTEFNNRAIMFYTNEKNWNYLQKLKREGYNLSIFLREALEEKIALEESNEKDTQNIQEI